MRLSRLAGLAFAATSIAIAAIQPGCSGRDHPPPLQQQATTSGAGAGGDEIDAGDYDGPPPLDAAGLCGNQLHQAIVDAPNLYFVLDASGSMAALEGSQTRYDAVRNQVVNLVRKLGPLINVGAAVFPRYVTDVDQCHVGGQVFPVTPGDPITGTDGPTTDGFRQSTIVPAPFGGTPTAATLEAITPTLLALEGRSIVLLSTDGGPNCDATESCGAEECIANIEGQCDPAVNCCAANQPYGPSSCIDRDDTVAAIEALASAGIDVYVIGVPGSEVYASVLDEMAQAGNVPQPSPPYYYRVDDVAALGGVLSQIASVAISCAFDLVDPPPVPGNTNVYLDGIVLPYDVIDGWKWKTSSVVELVGEACTRLKTGQVATVQIVSGCPTEVPK